VNLPTESTLIRKITDNWSFEREMQAATVELLHTVLRTYLSANTKPGTRMPEPLQIPRPGGTQTPKRPRGTSMRELLEIVGSNVKREG
jgi:hypothetical protein